jgi:hypothetical protein
MRSISMALGGAATFVVAGEYQWPVLALVGLALCLAAPLWGARKPSVAQQEAPALHVATQRVCPQVPTHIGQRPARRQGRHAFALAHRHMVRQHI